MTTRIVAYCRVSSDEQAASGISLAAQEHKLRSYAEALDLTLVAVEVDAGASAKSLGRPALQRALGMLERGEADGIAILKLDRLTRSVRDLSTLLDRYFASGRYALISVTDSVDTRSAAGRLILNLLTSVAQWERETGGERTSVALQQLRREGKRYSRIIPYGFTDADGALVQVADEQSVIVEARTLRATGMSLRAVASTLAERGRVSRSGRPFAASAIASMVEPSSVAA